MHPFAGLLSLASRIGADPRDRGDDRIRRTLLVAITLGVLPIGIIWGLLYWVAGEPVSALFPWGYSVLSTIALAVYVRTRSFSFLRAVELSLILATPWLLAISLGGIGPSGGVVLWSFVAPIGAIALDGPRRALPWMLGFLVAVISVPLLAAIVRPQPAELGSALTLTFSVLNIATVTVVAYLVLAAFAEQRAAAQARLRDLLVNVLPAEIADRLSATQRAAIADQFPAASVLFADVVDFTPMSGRLPPSEVVGILDRLFSEFDDLVDACGLEKIKTIGDAYMVAAGVPMPRPDHAHALAHLALDMRSAAARHARDDGAPIELRIGINSGPVVAGVIGRRRFLYDLWGDAVNTASRMESHGSPGQIQITRATYELIRDGFDCEPHGMVDVKGKGPMETWFLTAVRPHADADPRPAPSVVATSALRG